MSEGKAMRRKFNAVVDISHSLTGRESDREYLARLSGRAKASDAVPASGAPYYDALLAKHGWERCAPNEREAEAVGCLMCQSGDGPPGKASTHTTFSVKRKS